MKEHYDLWLQETSLTLKKIHQKQPLPKSVPTCHPSCFVSIIPPSLHAELAACLNSASYSASVDLAVFRQAAKTSPNSRLLAWLVAGPRYRADALWWHTDWMLHRSLVRSASPYPKCRFPRVLHVVRKWCKSIAKASAAGDSPPQSCRLKISWLTVHDRWMLSSMGEYYYRAEEERNEYFKVVVEYVLAKLRTGSTSLSSFIRCTNNMKTTDLSALGRITAHEISDCICTMCYIVWCVFFVYSKDPNLGT